MREDNKNLIKSIEKKLSHKIHAQYIEWITNQNSDKQGRVITENISMTGFVALDELVSMNEAAQAAGFPNVGIYFSWVNNDKQEALAMCTLSPFSYADAHRKQASVWLVNIKEQQCYHLAMGFNIFLSYLDKKRIGKLPEGVSFEQWTRFEADYYCSKGLETKGETSEKWYLKAAEMGSINAMEGLGDYYQYVLEDKVEAEKWYLKAIEKGQVQAHFGLGRLYRTQGRLQEAADLVQKAYDLGCSHTEAYLTLVQYELGLDFYKQGNYSEAKKWYNKAASSDSSSHEKSQAQKALDELQKEGY
ncbi:MAG: tetratricopeptide repeat protein [Deferribacteraceae bacterium]|jgi:TPR repeat protein|nr:tetratricopeptide repeat protein [Deferribacteraceae bacterium]